MNRELLLLSPYRLPSHYTLMLNADDVSVLLNGYLALWQVEAVRGSVGPPRFASPYDHEQPQAGFVYALPESPQLFLPEDWEQRAADAGAIHFRATADRAETERNLRTALGLHPHESPSAIRLAPLGLGFIVLDTLFEAMDHMNQINVPEFWRDVQHAVAAGDERDREQAMRSAAEKLREARDILYPSPVQFVDLALADDLTGGVSLPIELGLPMNLIASGRTLATLAREHPQIIAHWRSLIEQGLLEVCSGPYQEREDALLPIESHWENLRIGRRVYLEHLGQEIKVYGRRRFAASPELPQLLAQAGFTHALQLALDEGVIPDQRAAIIEWGGQDGRRIPAFTLKPHAADNPLTWFHLAHYLSKTMQQDSTAALAFRHAAGPVSSYYRDWLELNRLAPIFGQLVTLSRFFAQGVIGDHPAPAGVDEFLSNYLDDACAAQEPDPVSRFGRHARRRRTLEAAWTLAGLHRALVPPTENDPGPHRLSEIEYSLESSPAGSAEVPAELWAEAAATLAGVLMARAAGGVPGHLLFNPCSFARVVGVELTSVRTPMPAPARATQLSGDRARVAVEIPAFGFAWLPNGVSPGTKVAMPRAVLAEDRVLRNEFFEAEVDPVSGGLKSIRPTKLGGGRLGQQLCFGPGSEMRAESIHVNATGPALGEIESMGAILDGHQQVLCKFRQRFRVWWGRPLLELRFELDPLQAPAGYPWHAFYAARFAWRDPKAALTRATNFVQHPTTHTRPETPHYLELKSGLLPGRTAILTGGLPFLQRHSQRMVDVILMPEGETCRVFELAIGIDLEEPMRTALDWITPTPLAPTTLGPPHTGASGWLFHLDAANVVMTSLRPAADNADAVTLRLLECRGVAGPAELRCARNPVTASLVDELDHPLRELAVLGDAVQLEFTAGQMQRLRIAFA